MNCQPKMNYPFFNFWNLLVSLPFCTTFTMVLKLSLKEKNVPFPNGASWHKELLKLSVNHKIITEATMIKLGEYLAFRHFFNHSYALDLYAEKLEPLVENIRGIYKDFQKDISSYLAKLK